MMLGFIQSRGMDLSWAARLPELFRAHGLDVPAFARHPIAPELRSAWTGSHLGAFEEMSHFFVSKGPGGQERMEKMGKLVRQAEEEVRSGAALVMDMVVCVGTKTGT